MSLQFDGNMFSNYPNRCMMGSYAALSESLTDHVCFTVLCANAQHGPRHFTIYEQQMVIYHEDEDCNKFYFQTYWYNM